MSRTFDRRTFFRRGMTTSIASLGTGCLAAAGWAIDPIKRNGRAKFKFSLAAYSYRDLLTGGSPPLTLADFIDDCAKMNLDGAELTSYYFPVPTTDDYLRKVKQQCFMLGLDVSGTAVGNDFGLAVGSARDEQIANLKQWIDRAVILGAPVIRIFAGRERDDATAQEEYALMVAGIEECCDYAGQRGVYLALENHGGPTATPEGMLSFIRDVKSPWFGVNLDTGNFFSDDSYADLEMIAPYAVNVQLKVVTSNVERTNKKRADFGRIARMLRNSGYRGYIVLEYEESGDPRVECPKYIDRIRAAFA